MAGAASVEGILGALGGISVFAGAVWAIVRASFKLRASTDDNTRATEQLTKELKRIANRVDQHDIDIAVLKDRLGRQ